MVVLALICLEASLVRKRFMSKLVLGTLVVTGCAVNPVTGKSELSLVSESQEVQMGLEGAQQVSQLMGLLADSGFQAYVNGLGQQLAARSERPQLPWGFRVVDDPVVNAFALPGGQIFVTRGILTHFNSEAELVSVLGHEIGHVTAKHSVRQMSRTQLAQLGLGIGMILKPSLQDVGQIASAGLGVLFLKFGRDDENQADELGFKYALSNGYDVRDMLSVFQTLDRISGTSGRGMPEWLSTHPNPGNRYQSTQQRIAALNRNLDGLTSNRDSYLRRLDGMVFGENPRLGYFTGSVFYHPDLEFRLEFPDGWNTQNGTQAVVAGSPQNDAIIALTLAGTGTPGEAAREFFAQDGVQAQSTSTSSINGLQAVTSIFTAQTQDGTFQGRVAFIAHGGTTYRILAYSPASVYGSYGTIFRRSVETFQRLTDRAALSVQPARVSIVKVPSRMSLEDFNRRYPSTIPIAQLALINGVEETTMLAAGQLVKRVVGGELPGS